MVKEECKAWWEDNSCSQWVSYWHYFTSLTPKFRWYLEHHLSPLCFVDEKVAKGQKTASAESHLQGISRTPVQICWDLGVSLSMESLIPRVPGPFSRHFSQPESWCFAIMPALRGSPWPMTGGQKATRAVPCFYLFISEITETQEPPARGTVTSTAHILQFNFCSMGISFTHIRPPTHKSQNLVHEEPWQGDN